VNKDEDVVFLINEVH